MTAPDLPFTQPVPEPAGQSTIAVAAPATHAPATTRRRALPSLEVALWAVAVGAAATGIVVRFMANSSLWLDEALTVNISRLPLPQLFDALRHDGSPPAYYVLLHGWMRLFGTGDTAVRTLPAIISVATLVVAWRFGRLIGGRAVSWSFVILVASLPFAIRYGSENRMYSTVMLLSMFGGLALIHCLRNPTPRWLVAFGLTAGLLLLTHYWALYLVAATGAILLFASVRGTAKEASRLTLAALGAGSLMFLPWAPSFLFQMAHTGTPWSTPASATMFVEAVGEFAGWQTHVGIALFIVFAVVLVTLLTLTIASTQPRARQLAVRLGMRAQLPGERWIGPIFAVAFGTLLIALVGGIVSGATFAFRYASVVMPAVIMLVALGTAAIGITRAGRVVQAGVVAVAALIGLPAGAQESLSNRTEATLVASRIQSLANPGDVIVYCPDQLGPAVSRILPNRYVQVTFPRFDPPAWIDWVDYAKVNAGAPPAGLFAHQLINLAGPSQQIWLVYETGYRTLGFDCEELRDSLEFARPNFTQPVVSNPVRYYEHESLMRFAPY